MHEQYWVCIFMKTEDGKQKIEFIEPAINAFDWVLGKTSEL